MSNVGKMFQLLVRGGGYVKPGAVVSLKVWDKDDIFLSVNDAKNGIVLKQDQNPFKTEFLFRVYAKRKSDNFLKTLFKTQYVEPLDYIGLEPVSVPETFLLNNGTFGLDGNRWQLCVKQLRNNAKVGNMSYVYFLTQYNNYVIKYNLQNMNVEVGATNDQIDANFNDAANDPFQITTLLELVNSGRATPLTYGQHGNLITYIYRPIPPTGYLALGDVIQTSSNNEDARRTGMAYINVIFVKEKSADGKEIYARYLPDANNRNADPSGHQQRVNISEACNMFKDGKGETNSYLYLPGPKLYSINGYTQIGAFANVWSKDYPAIVGLRNDLFQQINTGMQYAEELRDNKILKETPYNQLGRLFSWSYGAKGGCDFELYSSAVIFDRRGLSTDLDGATEETIPRGYKTYCNTFGGLARTIPGWNLKDMFQWGFENCPMFVLFPKIREAPCCRNQDLGPECGVGDKKLINTNPICLTIGTEKCKGNKIDFSGKFCQREMCKTDPLSSNPLNCDEEYKTFCKKQSNDGTYYNYLNYPDLCACFMPKEFLTKMCDNYWDKLTTPDREGNVAVNKKNMVARRALKLITDPNDPDKEQCSVNCLVNPICRLGSQVPPSISVERAGNSVVIGKQGLPSTCSTIELCVQDVKINNSGDIKELNINQSAKCKTVLSKVCVEKKNGIGNVVYDKCNLMRITPKDNENGVVRFFKKLLSDDTGQCAEPGSEFECLLVQKDPILDDCIGTKRQTVFKSLTPTAFGPDVVEAVKSLDLYKSQLQYFNPSTTYDYINKTVTVLTDCADCKVGQDILTNEGCHLSGNIWKGYAQRNVQKTEFNKGKCPPFDKTKYEVECFQDKDCILQLSSQDQGCINGKTQYKFNIKEYQSQGGKTCNQAVLDTLKAKGVNIDKVSRVEISDNLRTVVAETSCEDCKVDFVIDQSVNGGECVWDETQNSFVVTKIGKLVKPAVGGGVCSQSEMDKVGKQLIERCSQNQSCQLQLEPTRDECNDVTGVRVITYGVKKPQVGKGTSCLDVGKKIAQKYSEYGVDKVTFETTESGVKEVKIVTSCLKSKDCKIDFTKQIYPGKDVQGVCDPKTKLSIEMYKVIDKEVGRGKSCEDLVKEKIKDSVYSMEEDYKMYVYKNCEPQLNAPSKVIVYVGVACLVIILIVLIKRLLKK